MIRIVLIAILLGAVPLAAADSVLFTFRQAEGGGIARSVVNVIQGQFVAMDVLYQSPEFESPAKLSKHPENGAILAASAGIHPGNLVLLPPDNSEPRLLDLDHQPDEIRAAGGGASGIRPSFVVGGKDGLLCVVDAETGDILARVNSRRDFTPSANQPEDILVLSGGDQALVTFQKDSASGKHQGGRVILFGLPGLEVLADVTLPRDQPELHVDGDNKEQGPGPEIILAFEESDTAVISLDLYGGMAFCSLSGLLAGKLENYQAVPTSRSGEPGIAFPDRVAPFRVGNQDFLLVSNASAEGVAVLSIGERTVVQRFDIASGLETPVSVSNGTRLVSVQSGKTKERADGVVEKETQPEQSLFLFDVSEDPTVPLAKRQIATAGLPLRVAAPSPQSSVVVFAESASSGFELVLFDTSTLQTMVRQPAPGEPRRMIPGN